MLLPLSLLSLCATVLASMSPKRGLIYIGNRENQADNKYWAASGTSMTWYYNYGFYQTRVMQNSNLQYVPMLWGAPASGTEVDFQKQVKGYKDGGMNITYVLGFNEPDHTKDGGGSDIPLADAVRHWKSEMEPTRNLGVKLGSPATVGNVGGIQWLQSFIKACNGCHIDFIALHYYGSFEGMASYIGQARDAFRNVTNEFWLTEFALPAAPLDGTERAFNQSVGFLDNANNRYVMFIRS
jgi:hypothetical protein